MARIAINGFGRIGRAVFKIALKRPDLEVVAVNDLVSGDNLAYLLKYDTVYGRLNQHVSATEDVLIVGDERYKLLHEKDPAKLPWRDLKVDVALECTGRFTDGEGLGKHLAAGARAAIVSAPSKDPEMMTVVHGVSDVGSKAEGTMRSCASCTTNCVAPVMEVIDRRLGIKKAIMTTVHAYTASQAVVDGPSSKFRRGRAAAANFIPTSTGAAKATAKVLPKLKGKFDGVAVRGPVPTGSLADIVILVDRPTSVEEVNRVLREEAATDKYTGVLEATDEQIVSSDVIADPHASIVDLSMTQVVDGDLVKVMAWYDNEWGYANQLVRHTAQVAGDLPPIT